MLLQDARDYQILFLSLFLLLGISTRDWTLRPDLVLVVIGVCLVTQWAMPGIMSYWSLRAEAHQCEALAKDKKQKPTLRSALITAFSLSLLLRADHYTTIALAGFLAISSKFLLQVHSKHFFNPANFGIIAVLVLTPDAWVSPGQWGEEGWYALLFAGTGGIVLKRVGRWDTTVAFLTAYTLLEAIRNLWLGWTWDVLYHRLMSGSLLLFALFMITDPRSIPNARISRLLWAICIAGLTFVLRNQFFVSSAIFWALFALSPLTILLDFIWSAPRFSWLKASANVSSPVENESIDTNLDQYSQVQGVSSRLLKESP